MNSKVFETHPEVAQFFFDHFVSDEGKGTSDDELIRMLPYGITVGTDLVRPVLILKGENVDITLPVPLNPLEAGVTIGQANKFVTPASPHKATQLLLEALGLRIERCVFVELKGQYQFVRLDLSGHPTVKNIRVRADEAMSLCAHLEVPMYATREIAQKSRSLHAEIEAFKRDVKLAPELLVRPPGQRYIN